MARKLVELIQASGPRRTLGDGHRNRKTATPTALVDLHTHLLHDLDDGPQSLREAEQLARALIADGTRTVVATPHVSRSYPATSSALDVRLEELRRHLRVMRVQLDVRSGAEVDIQELARLDDAQLRGLALGRSTWLLLECPHIVYPFGMLEWITELRGRGFQVVLAHPERSPHLQSDPRLLADAVAAGAVAQITGASLRGCLGRRVEKSAWAMMDAGMGHIVASDSHDTVRRPPDMTATRDLITARRGAEVAEMLTARAPEAVLAGADQTDILALGSPGRSHARGVLRRLRALG